MSSADSPKPTSASTPTTDVQPSSGRSDSVASPWEHDLVDQLLLDLAAPSRVDGTAAQRRQALRDLLIARPARTLPESALTLVDRLLSAEQTRRPQVSASELPRWSDHGSGARISLWQGDITTLKIDVIVNAANSRMLGCFRPEHRCVDNAIHGIAGPRLREACADHIDRQGGPEPTGTATLTEGFHLPARSVAHTVGPIVGPTGPIPADRIALAGSYRSCLDLLLADDSANSIAFCSVSTGVFGYPIEEATAVAVDTTLGWLAAHPTRDAHVVFVTFSDRDTEVYRSTLQDRLG